MSNLKMVRIQAKIDELFKELVDLCSSSHLECVAVSYFC